MIGHALLSTNFIKQPSDSLPDLVLWLAPWPHVPKDGGSILIFENYFCKLPIGKKFQLGNNSYTNCLATQMWAIAMQYTYLTVTVT